MLYAIDKYYLLQKNKLIILFILQDLLYLYNLQLIQSMSLLQIWQKVQQTIERKSVQQIKNLYVKISNKDINIFLKQLGLSEIQLNNLVSSSSIVSSLNSILVASRQGEKKFKQTCETKFPQIIQELKRLNKPIVVSQAIKQGINIDGNMFSVKIAYDSKKMNYKHSCGRIQLHRQLQKFIKYQIGQITFSIPSPIRELRILQFKEEISDQYTDSYQFDPFCKSIKFLLTKKNGDKFTSNFKIVNLEKIQIITEEGSWVDDQDFQLSDPASKIIDYVCKRVQATPEQKEKLSLIFKDHEMTYIKDLTTNPKQFIKSITVQKWANEVLAAILKVTRQKARQFTGNEKIDDRKKICYRVGNSHKILRFLYFKNNNYQGNGLWKLKTQLPYIYPANLKAAIDFVKSELLMDRVFKQIQDSLQAFTITPNQNQLKKLSTPFGMLFYGPPGTGKTKLTQDLMELAGFHPISRGLSSAEFMKQLVGQSKGMVQSYLFRPNMSKHLICTLSIDQIDSIVGNRSDEKNKSSGQATSMFLSALGGNQAVENILLLGSTNYKSKIDDAILRRLIPNIYVGLPNEEGRRKILKHYLLSNINNLQGIINYLTDLTPNFSGVALKNLSQQINNNFKLNIPIDEQRLLTLADRIATYYKIKLGDETYPQLRKNFSIKIEESIFKTAYKNIFILNKKNDVLFEMGYICKQKKWVSNRIIQQMSIKVRKISFSSKQPLLNYIKNLFDFQNIMQVKEMNQFKLAFSKNQKKKLFVLYSDNYTMLEELLKQIYSSQFDQKQTFFVVLYENNKQSLDTTWILEILGIPNTNVSQHSTKFTGRVFIDLSQQKASSMEFQIVGQREQIQKVPLYTQCQSTKAVLPQIIQYFVKRQIGAFQVINNSLLVDHNAFSQEAGLKLISNKLEEFQFYEKAVVIFELDDLVSISRSFSNSSTGISESISINQMSLYRNILLRMNKLPNISINLGKQIWVVIIVQNQDLAKMVRKQILFPPTLKELQESYNAKKKQQIQKYKKENKNQCVVCHQFFTIQQNQGQKKCPQHYGPFVIEGTWTLVSKDNYYLDDIAEARLYQRNQNQKRSKDNPIVILHSCCWNQIGTAGCRPFKHWSDYANRPLGLQLLQDHEFETQKKKYIVKAKQKCQNLRKTAQKILIQRK